MTRQAFASTLIAAGATGQNFGAANAQTSAPKPMLLELRYFYLRNTTDGMPARLNDFLSKTDLPASREAGAAGIGYFGSNLAPRAPFVLALRGFTSIAAYEAALPKLTAAVSDPALTVVRMETQLLRAFKGMPNIAAGPASGPARLLELRTYESPNPHTLAKKVGMFNDGEIAIFRKTGLDPVFFGEMLAGPNQPCLVYMLGYESMAAREANWAKFIADPEWLKLRATPGLSDGEIVSNITSAFLRPLPFSTVR
jgi:hypothetical protein